MDVEDLPADRQQRLVLRRARQPGGTQRAVSLHNEQLAALDSGRPAVHQLRRHRRAFEGGLSSRGVLLLLLGQPHPCGVHDLLQDGHRFGPGLAILEPLLDVLLEDRLNHFGDTGCGQLVLGLRGELRLRDPDVDDRGHALQDVVEDGQFLLGLEQAATVPDRVGQRPYEGALEPFAVRATMHVANRVREALDGPLISGTPSQRHLDLGATLHIGAHDSVLVGGVLLVRALAQHEQRRAHCPVPRRREEVHHIGETIRKTERLRKATSSDVAGLLAGLQPCRASRNT